MSPQDLAKHSEPISLTERRSAEQFQRRLAAAVAGEQWAFTELYETYARRLKAFAMSRRAADADGVANDVMLRVFQNLATFEGSEAKFVSWIFTIARNRLIDLHRAAQRRPQLVDEEPALDAGSTPSAEETAVDRLGGSDVLSLLDELTDDQRDVIVMRMINDQSLEAVSEVLGKPVTAVKALQRRALKQLQKKILARGVSQ